MKTNHFKRFTILFTAFIMIFSFFVIIYSSLTSDVYAASKKTSSNKRPTYTETLQTNNQLLSKLSEDNQKNQNIKKAKNISEFSEPAQLLTGMIKSGINGEDFNYAGNVVDIYSSVATSICACFGLGELAEGIFDLYESWIPGETPMSETQRMQDDINQQFAQVQDSLYDLEKQVSQLSDNINLSTTEIINSTSTQLDNLDAKQYVRAFMFSGEGNFNYNLFRNYLYGSTSGENIYFLEAHYNRLLESIVNKESEDIIKENYDALYSSLYSMVNNSNYITMFYEYLLGGDGVDQKSIIQYYYDFVSSRRDLLKDNTTAEYEALSFAFDLYQTSIRVNSIIKNCNAYQVIQMYEESVLSGTEFLGSTKYYFNENTNESITYDEILQNNVWLTNIENLTRKKMANDIAYIFNLSNSYIVKDASGDIYEVANNNDETYGQVISGQTIYLNNFSDEISNLFDFDINQITYKVSSKYNEEGIFDVNDYGDDFTAIMYYDEGEVYSINFNNNSSNTFNGGNGTEEDPYLISNFSQFKMIKQDLTKAYKLIQDIDCQYEIFEPIGDEDNPFTGILDGNGYSVKYLNNVSKIYDDNNKTMNPSTGLIGYLSEYGIVKNLNLVECSVNSNVDRDYITAENDNSYYYVGGIVGKNDGTIYNCNFINSYVFVERENENKNRNIYLYTGGITGVNNGNISFCAVKNSSITASSKHSYGNEADVTNKHSVYVGGISGQTYGFINNCYVDENVNLSAYAVSTTDGKKTTKYPRITVKSAGITPEVTDISNIYYVYSEAKNVLCEYKNDYNLYAGGALDKYCHSSFDLYVTDQDIEDVKKIIINNPDSIPFPNLLRDYEVSHSFNCAVDNNLEYPIDAIYASGEQHFNSKNLKIFINSTEVEYTILQYYNFNTKNESFSTNVKKSVKILFSAIYNGELVFLTEDVDILIKPNTIENVEILEFGTLFLKETNIVEAIKEKGIKLKVQYAVGLDDNIIIDENNINELLVECDTSSYGKTNLTFKYKNFVFNYEVIIICNHNVNNELLQIDNEKSKKPTCCNIGYSVYVCSECDYTFEGNYIGMTEHTLFESKEKVETCLEEGLYSQIYCEVCGLVYKEGIVIPKLSHKYVYFDEHNHVCTSGTHDLENHQYTVTESIIDGVFTYVYKCIECGYNYHIKDENINTIEQQSMPSVIVSDGYAVNTGDIVSVYVQLINNPGVSGANFGIRYDNRLKLVEFEEGMLFAQSLAKETNEVNYGYNFVWGNAQKRLGDGNLLKINFLIPEDAKQGDEYNISVVYGMIKGVEGGFSTNNGIEKFLTRNGTIRMVDHLPGDVNSDYCVDIMDALLIGRYLVQKIDYLDPLYADVNLDEEINLLDMIAILQFITGGYGSNLLNHQYRVKLNANGLDIELDDLLVDLYGDNNTYSNLVDLVRDGYTFEGWYTRLEGGDEYAVNSGDEVEFRKEQLKQTLYAHWSPNSIEYLKDQNQESTTIYYSDKEHLISIEDYQETYTINFINKYNDQRIQDVLIFNLDYWIDKDDNIYYVNDTIDLSIPDQGNIVLMPKMKSGILTYPNWSREGYQTDILWYGDEYYSQNKHIEKIDDILSLNTVDGEYYLYAKWVPISFDLDFELNGGMGLIADYENCSIINPYIPSIQGNIIDHFTKEGYTFAGWKDNFGNIYTGTSNIGYIKGATEGCTITLTAQWSPKQYDLELSIGTGIKQIFYKVNDSTNYKTTTTSIDIKVNYGTEYYVYAISSTGYTYDIYTISNPYSSTMTTYGAKFNPVGIAKQYNVTLDDQNNVKCDHESSGTEQIKVYYGSEDISINVPTKSGYDFVGYYSSTSYTYIYINANGTSERAWDIDKDTTLYAKWNKKAEYQGYEEIDSAEDLIKIKNYPNTNYLITKCIDYNNAEWKSVTEYTYKIEGCNHTIKNMSINSDDKNCGFIGYCDGYIFNLNFYNITVSDSNTDMNILAGVVVGELGSNGIVNGCQVDYCSLNVSANDNNDTENSCRYTIVGGVVGKTSGTVSSCTVKNTSIYGYVKKHDSAWSTGWDEAAYVFAGGIVGEFYAGSIINNTVVSLTKLEGYAEYRVNSIWPVSSESYSRICLGGIIGRQNGSSLIQSGNYCYQSSSLFTANFNSYNDTYQVKPNEDKRIGAVVGCME